MITPQSTLPESTASSMSEKIMNRLFAGGREGEGEQKVRGGPFAGDGDRRGVDIGQG